MEILDFIVSAIFILFMVFLVIGFNRQMIEKNKAKEERLKNKTRRQNE